MLIVRIILPKKELRNLIKINISILLFGVVSLLPAILNSYPEYNLRKREVYMPPIVEDWKWIVMTIIQEAALEPLQGKIMVAEVIRDRAANRFNSDGTIVGTILAPRQFSGWNTNDPTRIRSAKLDLSNSVVQDAIKAYNMAFEDKTNYALGANLYHADYMNPYPDWTKSEKVTRLTQFGHHIFYKEER